MSSHNRGRWTDEERCAAKLLDTEWARRWTDGRCSNHEHYIINSKRLCGRHAALEALHLALKNGTATRLPYPMPREGNAVDVVEKKP